MFLTRCISYFLLFAWIFSSSQSYAISPVNFDQQKHFVDISQHEPVSESAEQYLNAVEIDFKNEKSRIFIPTVDSNLNNYILAAGFLHYCSLLHYLNNTATFPLFSENLLIRISILRI